MKLILAGLLITTASGASAQAVCEAILRSANYNQYQSVSKTEQYALTKANFCVAEYDKATSEQRVQIEASYKLFSGSGSSDQSQLRERQRQECSGNYGEYWFSELGFQSQKVVSDAAMTAVSRCIDALSKGLRVEPTLTADEGTVIVSLTWTRSTSLPFRGLIRAPARNMRVLT